MILFLAIGHRNYFHMAANAAATIKTSDPSIPICLAYYGQVPESIKKLFTDIIPIPVEYITKNGKITPFRAKTLLHKITPYDKTLYLDADVILFNSPISNVIDEFKHTDFTATNWGEYTFGEGKQFHIWGNQNEIAKAYDIKGKKYVPLHSELMWFTKEAAPIFELANQIFDIPKVKVDTFAGDVPDEFAFNIACTILGKYPHQMPYRKLWWANHLEDRKIKPELIYKTFAGMSMAGNFQNEFIVNRYNQIVKYAALKQDIPQWRWQPKRKWLPERQAI